MARRQQQPKRDKLEALLRQGRHYAEWNLRNYGSIPPSAMALSRDGIMLMVPPRMATEKDKDDFSNAARMLTVGYGAEAVCMILESWAVFAEPDSGDLLDVVPSESPRRIEVVALFAQMKGLTAQQILKIKREGGEFAGFESDQTPPKFDEVRGRFAQILPPKEPTESEAQMARFVVAGMGYVVEGKGQNPTWN
jgi:hypothetical protein